MRAAIVLFFSTFLPLISFFSLLFLFGEITLKVHQLLYYYQRPTPSLHHDTALLAWQMEMFMFLAIPFVVFYFLTVTLSMATCSHAEVRPMSFGSLGIYHCVDLTPDTETMELGDQMNPYKLLLGMMLIPTVLLNYRLIMHCVRPKPGCVRTLLALRVSRQQLNMENVKLTKLLSPTLRGQLSDLFDTMLRRQKVKKDLLRACLTAVHPGENDDGNAATRTTHLPPIGRVQNLRNAIRSSKDGGAGKSWPEVELAVRICDHPEAFSEVHWISRVAICIYIYIYIITYILYSIWIYRHTSTSRNLTFTLRLDLSHPIRALTLHPRPAGAGEAQGVRYGFVVVVPG